MDSVDVMIVGAGLTGLTLARNLTEQGIDFLLLEGRDRIGEFTPWFTPWFFSHFNNLFKLLKKIKVELTDQYSKDCRYSSKQN